MRSNVYVYFHINSNHLPKAAVTNKNIRQDFQVCLNKRGYRIAPVILAPPRFAPSKCCYINISQVLTVLSSTQKLEQERKKSISICACMFLDWTYRFSQIHMPQVSPLKVRSFEVGITQLCTLYQINIMCSKPHLSLLRLSHHSQN